MSCLKITTPAMIRFMEWAREDLKSDLDIHYIVEYLERHYDDKPVDMAAVSATEKYLSSVNK